MRLTYLQGDLGQLEYYAQETAKHMLTFERGMDYKRIEAPPRIRDIMQHMLDGKGAVLSGQTGTGKTISMEAAMRVITHAYDEVARMPAETMVKSISQEEGYTISGLHLSPLLYIDDVGREKDRYIEYGQEIRPFEEIITQRYDMGYGQLFITTNLDVKAFQSRYGDRVLSRVIEMSGAILTIKGKNFRYEQAKAN